MAVKRILVATDRSPTAGRAVEWAAEMAERYGARLLVLRVLSPDGAANGAAEELRAYAAGLPGDVEPLVVVNEDPSDGIVEAAERERADVVVVGNVGMSGRKQFLLGNVPNRVSHNARCTVVIVNTAAGESRRFGRRR